jgi:hypothetical protein
MTVAFVLRLMVQGAGSFLVGEGGALETARPTFAAEITPGDCSIILFLDAH